MSDSNALADFESHASVWASSRATSNPPSNSINGLAGSASQRSGCAPLLPRRRPRHGPHRRLRGRTVELGNKQPYVEFPRALHSCNAAVLNDSPGRNGVWAALVGGHKEFNKLSSYFLIFTRKILWATRARQIQVSPAQQHRGSFQSCRRSGPKPAVAGFRRGVCSRHAASECRCRHSCNRFRAAGMR